MNQLQREAVEIAKELGDIVFVGAVAVNSHLNWRHRTTRDFDIAMATTLTKEQLKEELEKKGYRTFQERGKEVIYSPRNAKVDIYTKDVSGILIDKIYSTAKEVLLGNYKIRVASPEVMLVAKLRAMRPSRPQDKDDFTRLCIECGKSIDWKTLERIATEMEVSTIKESIRALSG
jgi:hypothetical protein